MPASTCCYSWCPIWVCQTVVRLKKWDDNQVGFRGAMLLVGALCFYPAHFGRHFGRISSTLILQCLELRRTCFCQAHVARAVLPPGAMFRAWAFALPPCGPKSHMRPFPHLGYPELLIKHYWRVFRQVHCIGNFGNSCEF